jgi:hypothetical protein
MKIEKAVLLLGGLLLGQAMQAKAQGVVTVTQMVAGRCAEMETTCEWKISCRVGNGPETSLSDYWTATGAAEMDLSKTLDIPSLPATLSCKLEEDDGWFGTSWDDAGTSSMEIPGGGNFDFNVGSEEEGTLILKLRVDTMEVNEPAPAAASSAAGRAARTPPPAQPRRYVGLFEGAQDGHAVVIGLPWDQFKSRMDALTEIGSKPTWLSSYEEGGTRYWSGIFHYYDGDYQLLQGMEWDPFFAKWKQLTNRDGLRLADFEIYSEKGKVLCTGLFELGSDKHNLRIGLTRAEMVAETARMAARGLRLVDVEVYSVQGRTLYAGAFREVTGAYGLAGGLSWEALQAKAKSLSGEEASFLDLETYVDGGRRLWDGAITGTSGQMTEPLEAKDFIARWKELSAKGQHLVSFETYR